MLPLTPAPKNYDNAVITITGIKLRKDGTFTTKCKRGNETLFTLVDVTPMKAKA